METEEGPLEAGMGKRLSSGLVEMLQGHEGMWRTHPLTFPQNTTNSTVCVLQAMLTPELPGPLPSTFTLTGSGRGSPCTAHLVPGIRRVYSLFVTAGLQEDADGIQLQEHLTGHCVKEGDVGKGCRGQQEDFPRRGLLAQF